MTRVLAVVATAVVSGAVALSQPPAPSGVESFDLAAASSGGRIEWASSEYPGSGLAMNLLAPTRYAGWLSEARHTTPHEIVVSFFSRQSALVVGVEINPITRDRQNRVKDVEVWVSTSGPVDGFVKIGAATLTREDALQPIAVTPTEARFVKLRFLSASGPDADPAQAGYGMGASRLRILEGQRPGYASITQRHPQLAKVLRGEFPISEAVSPSPASATSGLACGVPSPPARKTSAFPQSRQVLIVASEPADFAAIAWKSSPLDTRPVERPVVEGVTFSWVSPDIAAPAQLVAEPTVDTVVLAQVCEIDTRVSTAFKQALMAWVAAGHKLIIQDSDYCAGGRTPKYTFLPFPFATVNPGALGAKGEAGVLESSTLVSRIATDAAFIDTDRWKAGSNDLGDSNVIVEYDAHWCGAMWALNKLRKNGFALAYARHGRGLIIYDGFDRDQFTSPVYSTLITRELKQPFDGDHLPCSQPVGAFIITTTAAQRSRPMAAGKTFTYPIAILANHGYTGRVSLEADVTPRDPAVRVALKSTSADLTATDEAATILEVVAGPAASLTSKVVSVRGRDEAGKENLLCLDLPERRGGGLTVVSGLRREKPPTKNLEIILDASGSMKALLGKQSRWATAQAVLKDVVSKLPKDFSVGLRAYGHTLASTNPKTCTDSALVVPVAPLNPSALLAAASRLAPRGETPLVYSILQTPSDLKAAGGGTVILITDGEESCKGDFAAAARELEAAGLNLTLNIVGFTLKNQPAQAQLSALASSTGGRYYSAQSGAALGRALLLAAVDRLPYKVLNAAGAEVASGEAGLATDPHELAPGAYTVVVTAGEETLKVPVTIALGQDRTVKVAVKGDTLVAE